MELQKVINILNNYNGIFAKEYDLTEEELINFQDSFSIPTKELSRQYYDDYEGKKVLITYQIKCKEIIIK